jgi:hypothetical protein
VAFIVRWRSGRSRGPAPESRTSSVSRPSRILGGEHFEPGGGKFEGERQRIEPPADRGHGGAVCRRQTKLGSHIANAFDEEPDRRAARQIGGRPGIQTKLQCQRSDRVLALASHAKRRAARGQYPKGGYGGEEISNQRRRVQYLLEVVEHHQCRLIVAGIRASLGKSAAVTSDKTEGFGDGGRHQARIANGGQRDEHHASGVFRCDRACEFEREPGLPSAARSGEGDEAGGAIPKPEPQGLHI